MTAGYGVTPIAKAWIGLFVFLLIAMWKGCTEISYTLSGETVVGHVDAVHAQLDRRRRETGNWQVDYSFFAEDDVRLGRTVLGARDAATYEMGQEVRILYIAGSPRTNTLAAHRQPLWAFLVLGLGLAVVVVGVVLFIQAKRDVARDRRP